MFEFKRQFRGYDKKHVDAIIKDLNDEIVSLRLSYNEASAHIKIQDDKLRELADSKKAYEEKDLERLRTIERLNGELRDRDEALRNNGGALNGIQESETGAREEVRAIDYGAIERIVAHASEILNVIRLEQAKDDVPAANAAIFCTDNVPEIDRRIGHDTAGTDDDGPVEIQEIPVESPDDPNGGNAPYKDDTDDGGVIHINTDSGAFSKYLA